jgi:hypothetical protein
MLDLQDISMIMTIITPEGIPRFMFHSCLLLVRFEVVFYTPDFINEC